MLTKIKNMLWGKKTALEREQSPFVPWDQSRRSIYNFLQNNDTSKDGNLPDDDLFYKDHDFRWAAGALDGVFSYHVAEQDDTETAQKIFISLEKYLKNHIHTNLEEIYALLLEGSNLACISALTSLITENKENLNPDKLYNFVRYMTIHSPDRNPVKICSIILGLFGAHKDLNILMTLGAHDEFTLYIAMALSYAEKSFEISLWVLAKKVSGWGRIQTIRILSNTNTNPEIKHWLLEEGYHNDIMYEYTALICAETGELLKALQQDRPEKNIIKGAGKIIEALINGQQGPGAGIQHYKDGPDATKLYLSHIKEQNLNLEDFLIVNTIKKFLENGEDFWTEETYQEWTKPLRKTLIQHSQEILAEEKWTQKILKALESKNNTVFHTAHQAAEILKIDTWSYHYERQKAQISDEWFYLMRTKNVEHLEKTLTLAESQIPLNEITTGPALDNGLGIKYKYHTSLDFIVQGLQEFPGKGWLFVKANLESPVIRNRNTSLKSLAAWGKNQWPIEAVATLQKAYEGEPDKDLKQRIKNVIDEIPLNTENQESLA